MSEKTEIAWCDSTWNPWRGCKAVSPGCANCYAKKLVERWGGDFSKRTVAADATFNAPLRYRKKPWVCDECGAFCAQDNSCCGSRNFHRRRVFLGSLMDVLDPEVPIDVFARVLGLIQRCPELDFLLVTKRPELWSTRVGLAARYFREFQMKALGMCCEWGHGRPPHNIWLIATVENQEQADKRILKLLKIPAVVRGLSVEPMLGPIDFTPYEPFCSRGGSYMDGVDWVIFGGESGPGARPCNVEWIRDGVRQCKAAGVKAFVKQLGSDCIGYESAMLAYRKAEDVKGYKHPKGGDMAEWPDDLRVREWPMV